MQIEICFVGRLVQVRVVSQTRAVRSWEDLGPGDVSLIRGLTYAELRAMGEGIHVLPR